jgi:YidC/Oxa1 family membrane protein insertase
MDKRSVLALVLIAVVIVGGGMLSARLQKPSAIDSAAAPVAMTTPDSTPRAQTAAAQPSAAQPPAIAAASSPAPIQAETATVSTADRVARFTTLGAVPATISLTQYQDLREKRGVLTLVPNAGPLMRLRIVNGKDTIALANVPFTKTQTANRIDFTSASPAIRVSYQLDTAHYLTHASVSMDNAAPNATLLVDLARDLKTAEADTMDDIRHLAYGFRRANKDVESATFLKLDTLQSRVEAGPLEWIAIRNKYFVYAVLAPDSVHAFSGFTMRGGSRDASKKPTGTATGSLPMQNGSARFDLYTGPQSWKTLRAVGHELSNVNPYAGWAFLRPIVEPFATIVMRVLLGLKAAVGLSYGWVLVIFGVAIRLLLWPLNQTAMRTSIKMQRVQPELAVIQKKYAKDPEAQRTAMMKLYADHGMSPFSPLMGCLPMLIPMPILFALYFVFQNTIEFRGVPFLWLPDISLRDPFYITPILMGASMLVLSWIGMRAGPPNPQAKVMGYMMPAMFTVMFMNLASGLNMYYAVQNLIAIPQQWFLTRERAQATAAAAVKGTPERKRR